MSVRGIRRVVTAPLNEPRIGQQTEFGLFPSPYNLALSLLWGLLLLLFFAHSLQPIVEALIFMAVVARGWVAATDFIPTGRRLTQLSRFHPQKEDESAGLCLPILFLFVF